MALVTEAGDEFPPTPPLPPALVHWGTFRTLLVVRLVVCIVLSVVVPVGVIARQWPSTAWKEGTWPLIAIVLASTALGLVYYAAARRRSPPPLYAAHVIHWIDVGLATAAVWFLNGLDVFVGIPIYALIIVHTAMEVPATGVVVMAALAAAGYAFALFADQNPAGQAIFFPLNLNPEQLFNARLTLAIVNGIFLAVLTFLTTALAGVTGRQTARARAAETRLRAVNLGLEVEVAERTRAYHEANASLTAANLQLESINCEIELYARAVAHDVRSPIAAASETLRLLRRAPLELQGRRIDTVTRSLLHAERMLVGLRDLMRNRTPERVRHVAPRVLLEEIIEELRTARGAQALSIELLGSFADVEAQASKLAHVFRNLVDNAITQTLPRPDGRVEIGQTWRDGDAAFWVRDNGPGIPEEYRDAIFEPFHRGPVSNGSGMGLGLTLARQIVEQHGGRVWVESVPGRGATFWFTLSQTRSHLEVHSP